MHCIRDYESIIHIRLKKLFTAESTKRMIQLIHGIKNFVFCVFFVVYTENQIFS